ncbi:hypothetical protein DFP73DRAFT_532042 [Morchella snyderi]|nr:hypothetical protein DFP73DRAFT_532042 [Morchella snyderi]
MPVLKLTHTLASKPEVNSIWANIRYTLFGGDDGLSPSCLHIIIATNTQEGVHVCVQKKSSHPGWSQLRGDGEMLFLHANEKYSTTIHHPNRINRKEDIHILDDQGILIGGDETTSLLVTEAREPSIHTLSNLHHRRATASEGSTPSGIPIDPVPPSDAELPTAAIAGGVVVGVLGIVALCSLGFVWRRRQKKKNQPRVDTHEGKPDETELGLVVSAFGDPTHVQFTSIEERLEKGKENGSAEADNTGGAVEGHSANGVAEEVNLAIGVVQTDEMNVTPLPVEEAKPEVPEFEIQSVRD